MVIDYFLKVKTGIYWSSGGVHTDIIYTEV